MFGVGIVVGGFKVEMYQGTLKMAYITLGVAMPRP